MLDVLIVGAGPAGSVAATVLARAGARVRIVDRAEFPRAKLCGDTVNPGTLTLLRRLGLSASIEEHGLPLEGMRLTGEHGVVVDGPYPPGLTARAITRRDVDWSLLASAIAAGAAFEPRVVVRGALVEEESNRPYVRGVLAAAGGTARAIRSPVTIAADGRRSTLAFGLRLARHPVQPRRWALGAYFAGVGGLTAFGEMHVRAARYIGVAPLPGGLANVCLVRPSRPGDAALGDPRAVLTMELGRDPLLRERFAGARLVERPVVVGPLAVDVRVAAIDGLLLAGDAAGFIDPVTGDGLRFAVRGGELAATAALEALEHGWSGVHARLADRRHREFGAKLRFNRALRALVGSPRGLEAARFGARFAPGVFRRLISKAGDCDVARPF